MAKAKRKKITIEDALVPVDEQPYQVPEKWCWIKLGAISSIISKGTTPKGGKAAYVDDGIDFLRVENMNDDGTICHDNIMHITEKMHNGYLKRSILEEKDILVSIAGTLGKTAIVNKEDLPLNTNQAVAFVRLADNGEISREFIRYAMDTPVIQSMLLSKTKVTAIPNLTLEIISKCLIPFPPITEQQRIVEQIEGLFSKLDEVKEKIECLLDSKKVRCNSVLNKAFTGKLTAKWRENNNIKFETWEYINFEKIIVEGPQNGMYKPKTSYGSGTKILRIDCFYDGKLEPWEKLKRLEITDEEKDTYLLSVNDIVVNRVNSMPYLGKSALIRKLPEQCVFESNMMRIKINIRKANPEYVIRYLNSSIGLQELRKNAKQAVNQASINQQDVKMVKIALPSLEEQNEIVKIITSISNKDEAILNKAEAVIEEIDLMKKSILAKAFRGELGTNISKEKNSIEVLKKLIEEESK